MFFVKIQLFSTLLNLFFREYTEPMLQTPSITSEHLFKMSIKSKALGNIAKKWETSILNSTSQFISESSEKLRPDQNGRTSTGQDLGMRTDLKSRTRLTAGDTRSKKKDPSKCEEYRLKKTDIPLTDASKSLINQIYLISRMQKAAGIFFSETRPS